MSITFSVAPELARLGVIVKAALFVGPVIKKKNIDLENAIRTLHVSESMLHDPILQAYSDLHAHSGVHGFFPGAESLIRYLLKNGTLPNVNCVVDAYNLVSAESLLSIGAHDAEHLDGNLVIRPAKGDEHFVPLGSTKPQPVKKGEYVCTDEEKVICWLDIRQCAETKITGKTKAYLVYLQGNRNTSDAYLGRYLEKIIDYQTRFCGSRPVKRIEAAAHEA